MNNMSRSLLLAEQYLGKEVSIIMDRPLGSKHPREGFVYEVNYGYVPETQSAIDLTDDEIAKAVNFQEQWFDCEILRTRTSSYC